MYIFIDEMANFMGPRKNQMNHIVRGYIGKPILLIMPKYKNQHLIYPYSERKC